MILAVHVVNNVSRTSMVSVADTAWRAWWDCWLAARKAIGRQCVGADLHTRCMTVFYRDETARTASPAGPAHFDIGSALALAPGMFVNCLMLHHLCSRFGDVFRHDNMRFSPAL